MAKVKFKGKQGEVLKMFGAFFVSGEPVEINEPKALKTLEGNRFFEVAKETAQPKK